MLLAREIFGRLGPLRHPAISPPVALTARYDDDTQVLWIVLTGEIDFSEVLETLDGLFVEKYQRRIWDIRETTNRLSHPEMNRLAARLRELADDGGVRSALLTSSNLQFGMSRALQPRVDSDRISLGVFRSVDDAVAWVTMR